MGILIYKKMVRKVFSDENYNDLEFLIDIENNLVIKITNQIDVIHIRIDKDDLDQLEEEFIYMVNKIKNGQDE
jgi:hypothetical protein